MGNFHQIANANSYAANGNDVQLFFTSQYRSILEAGSLFSLTKKPGDGDEQPENHLLVDDRLCSLKPEVGILAVVRFEVVFEKFKNKLVQYNATIFVTMNNIFSKATHPPSCNYRLFHDAITAGLLYYNT